jgi:aryl-alcohol dehydrogenase-like predicted oxidoreductase
MKYRRLGKTNLTVSVVGIGTWQYGGEWGQGFDQPTVDAIFDAARGRGVNLIDTAECYGDHTSEALIGNAIHRDRDRWVVATKFGHVFHGPFDRTDERAAKDVRPQVEASLAALRTDRIDLLQYHSVRDAEFFDVAVRDELQRLVREGKVRFVGNSIGNAGPTEDGRNAQAARSTEFHADVLQVIYNRLDRKPEEGSPSLFDIAAAQDLGVLARVPLASGFLSGKYRPGDAFQPGDVRERRDPAATRLALEQAQEIQRTEVPAGVDMATWALAWCLRHPAVSAVIPGCKSAAQLERNADAAER